MEIRKKAKLIVFIMILTVFILGVVMLGPKFIYKVQMKFGFKGMIDNIEQCIAMPGCAITTDELDIYNHYKTFVESETGKEFKESELGNLVLPGTK